MVQFKEIVQDYKKKSPFIQYLVLQLFPIQVNGTELQYQAMDRCGAVSMEKADPFSLILDTL